MRSLQQHTKGIAIIEVLIAMLILGFGLVGVSQMQGKVVKQNTLAKQRVDAINIAEGKIEDLRNVVTIQDYEDNLTPGTYSDLTTYDADNTTNHYSADYDLYWTITEDSSKKFKTAYVRVQWQDMSNTNNNGNPTKYTTIDLTTVISTRRLPVALKMASSAVIPSPDPVILKPLVCTCNDSNSYDSGSSTWGGHMMKNDKPRFQDYLIKVGGGMMRYTPPADTTTANTTLCTECCNNATWAASLDKKRFEPDFLYARSQENKDWGKFQSSALIKPSLNNITMLDFGFKKTMKESGGGGGGHNNNTYQTYTAACAVDVSTSQNRCVRRMFKKPD